MKRSVMMMLSISILFVGIISAQGFGIKGGLNLGKFIGDDLDEVTQEGLLDEKYLMGFAAGGFFSLPIDPLDLRVEALYSQNGAKFETTEEGAEGSITMTMNWLDIPVLVGLNFGGFRVFAGPYFDLFLNGTTRYEVTYGDESFDEEDDIESEDIKSMLYGVVGGVAIGVTNNIDLEVRYSMGLNNFNAEPDDWDDSYGEYEESDLKPTTIQVLLNFYLTK